MTLVLGLAVLVAPAKAAELASEAVAVAVNNGAFKQLRQDLVMDMHQHTRYEYDEAEVEAVGRRLLAEGRQESAVEVLDLNQMIKSGSAPAANALGDAYEVSGNPVAARAMYQKALEVDPGNSHAAEALDVLDTEESTSAAGDLPAAGIDPEMLAAMGVPPEQIQQMVEALAQVQEMQGQGGATQPSSRAVAAVPATRPPEPPPTEAAYESEYCEVLYRFNSEKKITDPEIRDRFEGQYNPADDPQRLRTWSVESACGEFLVAVPMWADVSPPVLEHRGGATFEDSMGTTWEFQVGSDGVI
ncbi:MAG: hypothetical protein MUP13_17540, partial [Thermoanaerobaculales bacterium]|nr:hypothetical protein [Thermoanaerobaculales bacterium]